jgi:hypothetical protein
VRAILAYRDVAYADSEREATLKGRWLKIRPPRDGSPEISRWHELLLYEAGLLKPRPVSMYLPEDLSPWAMRVGNAIHLMLGLRWEGWRGDRFTWARRMSRARTGLTDSQARAGIEELESRRAIVRAGRSRGAYGGAIEYRLGLLIDILGSADAIAEEIMSVFDATDLGTYES